jgi:hypothetical protein
MQDQANATTAPNEGYADPGTSSGDLLCATSGLMRRSKLSVYSITSSARAET